ncbi:MAG: hypothetical protein LC799_31785, partial [Actinobacteria bacterium]|nr:hypothetical protein [Actinomycetota bacterium]
MTRTLKRAIRPVLAGVVLSAVFAGVAPTPASAAVSSVSGIAFGFYVNVGLFGGPRTLKGAGTTVPTTDISYSPSVTLPAGGSSTPVQASDPDGAKGIYGPAVIFGGIWPDNVQSAPS